MTNAELDPDAEARRRIAHAVETGATTLDLSGLEITQLPQDVRLTALTSLDLSECDQVTDLTLVQDLTALTSLNLSQCVRVSDFTPIQSLTALTSLDLSGCSQLSDLTPIHALTALTSLNLTECEQVRDLSPIQTLTALTSLNLTRCKQVSDLTPIGALTALTSLNLSRCERIEDFTPIRALTALATLDLSWCWISDLKVIQTLTALKSLDLFYSLAIVDLTPLQSLTALTSLNLNGCRQVSDLTSLQALTALTSLDFSGCGQVRDLTPIGALTALTHLHLFECKQVRDLAPLQALAALTSLDLGACSQVSDLTPLQALTALVYLDLSGCGQVGDLAPLQALTALTSLDLSGCEQVSDLTPIQAFTALQSLNLSECEQVSDLTPLQALPALTSLAIRWCGRISDLTPIQSLTALTSLDLRGCGQVSNLQPIHGLKALISLDLSECGQVSDLTPIQALPALAFLDLSGCQKICHLGPLLNLPQLRELMLKNHRASAAFAPLLPLLPTLHELDLQGSLFIDLDPAISDQEDNVLEAVRAHFADLRGGAMVDHETRIILLGNGRAGKTQLGRVLQTKLYDEAVPTTHGIQVQETSVALDDPDTPIPINLWDFGGQEIYHGSHALFLQGRAIFIVVWTPSLETTAPYEEHGVTMHHRPLAYWLDYIRAFSGASNPVILVQSQCDDRSRKVPQPPANLDGFESCQSIQVSAKTGYRIEELHAAIRKALRDSFEQREAIPIGIGRVRVRQKLRSLLEQDAKRYAFIERRHFDAICEDVGLISSNDALLKYLHHSGAVFYRPNLFGGRIILDQNWALQAVYTVFDRTKTLPFLYGNGRFTRNDLETLVWSNYTMEEQKLFLSFMESCGICFAAGKRPGEEDTFIAPELLPPQSEAERSLLAGRIPRDVPAVAVQASYEFLHEGILRNFLSRIGRKAGDAAVYWKYGCWFYEQTTDSRVMIEGLWDNTKAEVGPGSLRLRAWGIRASELLEPLVEEIEKIPSGQKPRIIRSEKPPMKATVEDQPEGDSAVSGFDRMRIQAPRTIPGRPKVFLSYAWGSNAENATVEDRQRGAVVEGLCESLASNGWEVVRDIRAMRFGDLISAFMKTISHSDLVIVVLSAKYLRSTACMTELYGIYEYSRDMQEFQRRIIPIVLQDAKISSPEDRVECAIHWSTRFEKLDATRMHLGEADAQQVRQMTKWHNTIGDILFHVSDTLHPHGFEEIVKDNFAGLREMLERKRGERPQPSS